MEYVYNFTDRRTLFVRMQLVGCNLITCNAQITSNVKFNLMRITNQLEQQHIDEQVLVNVITSYGKYAVFPTFSFMYNLRIRIFLEKREKNSYSRPSLMYFG